MYLIELSYIHTLKPMMIIQYDPLILVIQHSSIFKLNDYDNFGRIQ